MTTTKLSDSFFDPSLTPRNAFSKGYNYIDDIFYDLLNPDETIADILEICREFHCKLGIPNSDNLDPFFGLYIPREDDL